MFIEVGFAVDPEKVAKLMIYIAENTNIVYYSFVPVQTVCYNCGKYFVGYYERCPECGSDNIDNFSRIVGYYTSIRRWNPGRAAEFNIRRQYAAQIAL